VKSEQGKPTMLNERYYQVYLIDMTGQQTLLFDRIPTEQEAMERISNKKVRNIAVVRVTRETIYNRLDPDWNPL